MASVVPITTFGGGPTHLRRHTQITAQVVETTCRSMGIDSSGLDTIDRRILTAILSQGGRPVGLQVLASLVGEDPETIADVHEPYLIKQGYILRNPRGRTAAAKAMVQYLGEGLL